MELRQLRYFLTLADELNFTRAAQLLHIVQPALSQQIKELEEELGVLLFYRNKRKVELTEAGKVFSQEAEKILAQIKYASEQTKQTHAGTIGKIEIGYSSGSVLSGVLGQILARFRKAYPEVALHMQQVFPATQLNRLIQQEIDIIFGTSLSTHVPQNCRVFQLAKYPLHVVMPLDHPLAGQETVTTQALQNESFIAHSEPEEAHGKDFLRSVLKFRPYIAYYSNNLLFVRVLIEAGFGLAIMPSVMASAFTGRVTSRPLADTKMSFDVSAVIRKDHLNSAVEHLVTIAIETINEKNHPKLLNHA